MDLASFIRGLVIGFSIAAPVGPIGVLCIQRTLNSGRLSGLVSGLGAASADAVYGSIAAFSLTAISEVLIGQQIWLRLIGGAYLLYLGFTTMLKKPVEASGQARQSGLPRDYVSTFLLTMTNPVTILSFAAIFAGLGLAEVSQDYASAGWMVLGVFSGSSLWWFTLSGGVSLLRHRFSPRTMLWINRFSGTVIVLFGAVAVFGLFIG